MVRLVTGRVSFALGASCVLCATLVTVASDAAVTRPVANPDLIVPRIDGTLNVGVKTVDITDTTTATGTTSDASLTFSPSAGTTQLLTWVTDTLSGRGSAKTLAVVELDFAFKEQSVETFNNVSIAEIDFPALDARVNTTAFWTVKLTNAVTSKAAGSHLPQPSPAKTPAKLTKTNNFKVQVDGLDFKWATKVTPLVVRASLNPAAPPKVVEPGLRPRVLAAAPVEPGLAKLNPPTSSVSLSNFVITVNTTGPGAASYQQIQQWVSSGGAPKVGSIDYLLPNLTQALCTASFTGLSATKVTANNSTSSADIELKVSGVRIACPGI
jgi:hypothetical protein